MQNITINIQLEKGYILQGDLNGAINSYHIVLNSADQNVELLSISTKLIPKSYKIITNDFVVQSSGYNSNVKITGYLKKENIFKTTISELADISNGGHLKLTPYTVSEQILQQIESTLYYQPILQYIPGQETRIPTQENAKKDSVTFGAKVATFFKNLFKFILICLIIVMVLSMILS